MTDYLDKLNQYYLEDKYKNNEEYSIYDIIPEYVKYYLESYMKKPITFLYRIQNIGVIAGGSLLFNNNSGDIDIFVNTEKDFNNILTICNEEKDTTYTVFQFKKKNNEKSVSYSIITINHKYFKIPLQLIYSNFSDPNDLITNFDMDYISIALHKSKFYNFTNNYDDVSFNTSKNLTNLRLSKAIRKGFKVPLFGLYSEKKINKYGLKDAYKLISKTFDEIIKNKKEPLQTLNYNNITNEKNISNKKYTVNKKENQFIYFYNLKCTGWKLDDNKPNTNKLYQEGMFIIESGSYCVLKKYICKKITINNIIVDNYKHLDNKVYKANISNPILSNYIFKFSNKFTEKNIPEPGQYYAVLELYYSDTIKVQRPVFKIIDIYSDDLSIMNMPITDDFTIYLKY